MKNRVLFFLVSAFVLSCSRSPSPDLLNQNASSSSLSVESRLSALEQALLTNNGPTVVSANFALDREIFSSDYTLQGVIVESNEIDVPMSNGESAIFGSGLPISQRTEVIITVAGYGTTTDRPRPNAENTYCYGPGSVANTKPDWRVVNGFAYVSRGDVEHKVGLGRSGQASGTAAHGKVQRFILEAGDTLRVRLTSGYRHRYDVNNNDGVRPECVERLKAYYGVTVTMIERL